MLQTGKIIRTFKTQKGRKIVIRYPRWEDLDQLVDCMNELSHEDTYVAYSGEEVTKGEEMQFLYRAFSEMEQRRGVYLFAFIDDLLVAECDFAAHPRRRFAHVADIVISVRTSYRDEGIGKMLLECALEEAKRIGVKVLTLTCFLENERAIHIYESFGFQRLGILPKSIYYRGQYVDKLLMYKQL